MFSVATKGKLWYSSYRYNIPRAHELLLHRRSLDRMLSLDSLKTDSPARRCVLVYNSQTLYEFTFHAFDDGIVEFVCIMKSWQGVVDQT